jgi:hypothetical protein
MTNKKSAFHSLAICSFVGWVISFCVTGILRYLFWEMGKPPLLDAIGGMSTGVLFLLISSTIIFTALYYGPKRIKFYIGIFLSFVTFLIGLILLILSLNQLFSTLRLS